MDSPVTGLTDEEVRKYDKTVTFYKTTNDNAPRRALVFIHGGAWIDDKNTPYDFYEFSEKMIELAEGELEFSLYSIEYRLSPAIKHPTHMYDVIDNLYQLALQEEIEEINILGHSVGATLAWQVLSWTFEQTPFDDFQRQYRIGIVRSRLCHCFLVDGIFSLKELLDEYPSYNYFVSQAFRSIEEFDDPATSELSFPSKISIHVIHSYEDELLTLRQSNYLCSILQSSRQRYHCFFDSFGKHNDVYCNKDLARYVLKAML